MQQEEDRRFLEQMHAQEPRTRNMTRLLLLAYKNNLQPKHKFWLSKISSERLENTIKNNRKKKEETRKEFKFRIYITFIKETMRY